LVFNICQNKDLVFNKQVLIKVGGFARKKVAC